MGIVEIEVGMHPLAATQHVQLVDRAGQGSQNKEGGWVRPDVFREEFHVAPDGIYRIEGEAEDIADVGGNPAVAISLDQGAILLGLIQAYRDCRISSEEHTPQI